MRQTYALVLSLALLALPPAARAEIGGMQVIVHSSSGVSSLSRERLADLFLRKVVIWQDGGAVLTVDQSMISPVRRTFSQEVLGRPISAVQRYWEERIFSGRGQPPPVRRSDLEVIEFVARNPGAIGYVSVQTPLGAEVKVVLIRD